MSSDALSLMVLLTASLVGVLFIYVLRLRALVYGQKGGASTGAVLGLPRVPSSLATQRPSTMRPPPPAAAIPPEHIAVIAASVAAMTGKPLSTLRIVGVRPAEIYTPIWGFVDRAAPSRIQEFR